MGADNYIVFNRANLKIILTTNSIDMVNRLCNGNQLVAWVDSTVKSYYPLLIELDVRNDTSHAANAYGINDHLGDLAAILDDLEIDCKI